MVCVALVTETSAVAVAVPVPPAVACSASAVSAVRPMLFAELETSHRSLVPVGGAMVAGVAVPIRTPWARITSAAGAVVVMAGVTTEVEADPLACPAEALIGETLCTPT